jgi:type I restriction enzyme S subunit
VKKDTVSQWRRVRLGDLVEVSHGYAFDSAFFSNTPTRHILLTPGNFGIGGGFNSARFKYYNGSAGPVPPKYLLAPGDIVVALTDLSREGGILGCAARVPGTPFQQGQKILHNQRIGRVTIRSKRLNRDFLYWLLRCSDYRYHVLRTASGSTVRHTSPNRIKDYCFLLPPPAEQTAIAHLLNAVETRLRLLERSGSLLIQLAMNLYRHWFGRSPVPGQEPLKPLGDFGRIVCGKTPSKEVENYFGGPVLFAKIPDMRCRVYITRTADSLSYEGAAAQPRKQIPPNSICVSCIATVGLVALTATWCHTNQQINAVIPHHYRDRYYLYCRLKTMRPYLEALGTGGSTTLNLSTGRFSRVLIPQPPRSLLETFYHTVHPIFQRILLNTRHGERLTALKDTLLPLLMAGNLRIRGEKGKKRRGEEGGRRQEGRKVGK